MLASIRQRVVSASPTNGFSSLQALEEAFEVLYTIYDSFGLWKPDSVEEGTLTARACVRLVHNSKQMMRRTTKKQMRLMESICLHSSRALELYDHCLMEAEA